MAIWGTQNTPRNADGSYNFWADYYENGIIPNIWKGITGQTSANRNADNTNALNKQIADENLQFQRENLDYQKALQQQIFEREDTSYQRTVQDMLAAGLNPLSMAGTNGSGQVVSTNPLNNGMVYEKPDTMNPNEALSSISSMLSEINSVRTGKLERDSLQSQIDRQNLENFAFAKKNGIQYNPKGYSNDSYLDQYAQADLNALNRSNTTNVEKMLTYLEDLLLNGKGEEIIDKVKDKYPIVDKAQDLVDSVQYGIDSISNKANNIDNKVYEYINGVSKGSTKEKPGSWYNAIKNDPIWSHALDSYLNSKYPNSSGPKETQDEFYARKMRQAKKKNK